MCPWRYNNYSFTANDKIDYWISSYYIVFNLVNYSKWEKTENIIYKK